MLVVVDLFRRCIPVPLRTSGWMAVMRADCPSLFPAPSWPRLESSSDGVPRALGQRIARTGGFHREPAVATVQVREAYAVLQGPGLESTNRHGAV
jgi:hypothetical protein